MYYKFIIQVIHSFLCRLSRIIFGRAFLSLDLGHLRAGGGLHQGLVYPSTDDGHVRELSSEKRRILLLTYLTITL